MRPLLQVITPVCLLQQRFQHFTLLLVQLEIQLVTQQQLPQSTLLLTLPVVPLTTQPLNPLQCIQLRSLPHKNLLTLLLLLQLDIPLSIQLLSLPLNSQPQMHHLLQVATPVCLLQQRFQHVQPIQLGCLLCKTQLAPVLLVQLKTLETLNLTCLCAVRTCKWAILLGGTAVVQDLEQGARSVKYAIIKIFLSCRVSNRVSLQALCRAPPQMLLCGKFACVAVLLL